MGFNTMSVEENKNGIGQEIDIDKLLKEYAEVIFNTWRMGKNAKEDYENNKRKIDEANNKLDAFIDLLNQVDRNSRVHFVKGFNLEGYIKTIEDEKKSLEKTLKPLKNLSKKYERTLKILSKNGFQIMDYDGKKVNDGMAIKVLDSYPNPDVDEDTIIETVKPAIYFKNKMILMGEVIVGIPEEND